MRRPKRRDGVAVTALLVLAFAGCQASEENPNSDNALEPEGGVVTIWTDSSELFFEHPPLVADQPGEPWAVHLTALSSFQPVNAGVLTLRFIGPDGAEHVHTTESPSRSGVYGPAPSFAAPGAYDLTVEVDGPDLNDVIHVGPVIVHQTWNDVPLLEPEPPVGITFLKEQQWPIPFATVEVTTGEVATSIRAAGTIVPVANRVANVTALVDGILLADRNRSAAVPGQWVDAEQTLAVLSPVAGDNAFSTQRARAQRLEREVARLERLYAVEAVSARRLEEARHDLEVAEATLGAMGADGNDGYDLPLKAPIDGVVNTRHFALGERVEAGHLLMTLVDTRRVWVRLFVPASDVANATTITGATFAVEGGATVFRANRVVSIGQVLDMERRALPVVLEVENTDRALRVGMMATGRVLIGRPTRGLIVPTAAIRNEDGMLVTYVQIGGETFERRALTIGPSDGEWTLVMSGVRRGERVVTIGAYQVRLSSLSTTEISDHGHPH